MWFTGMTAQGAPFLCGPAREARGPCLEPRAACAHEDLPFSLHVFAIFRFCLQEDQAKHPKTGCSVQGTQSVSSASWREHCGCVLDGRRDTAPCRGHGMWEGSVQRLGGDIGRGPLCTGASGGVGRSAVSATGPSKTTLPYAERGKSPQQGSGSSERPPLSPAVL